MDTTYLVSNTPKDPANPQVPYLVVLPTGLYKRQIKRIYIPTDCVPTTPKFQVQGIFNHAIGYLFDAVGTSAVLEWDGSGWQLIGGNAAPVN
jgi:hypothetical protein